MYFLFIQNIRASEIIRQLLLLVALIVCSPNLLANNDASHDDSLRTGNSDNQDDFSWTLYVDLGVTASTALYIDPGQSKPIDYLFASVLLDVYYKGFFLEQNNPYRRANRQSTLGYRLHRDDKYQIDILFGQSYLDELGENDGNTYSDTPSEELAGIRLRETDFSQGLRFSMNDENRGWWIDVAADLVTNYHNGWVVDAYHSWLFPIRNWDVQLGVGATYFSDNMVDYFVGVRPEEATVTRPVYVAGDGYKTTAEVSAQYPINEDWLFQAGLVVNRYSSAFKNSPLYRTNIQATVGVGVVYVW